jgi:drug/metabolite transporter (DMT)-like permease
VKRRRADAALLFNTIVWGATFVLVKNALGGISPMLFLAARFGLAAVALFVLFLGPLRRSFAWRAAGAGALSGVFLFAGFAFQTYGLRLTSPPKSAFLTGMTSILAPFLAAVVYRIRPGASEIAGVLISVAGLACMTLERPLGSIASGDVLTLLGAAAFAAHIVTVGHFSESMPVSVLTVSQIAAAALCACVLLPAEAPRFEWRPAVLGAIAVTGLLCTAVAFSFQTWAMQYTTATRTAVIYMFEPVVAWTTSWVLAGVGLSARASLGAALILLGIILVELKPLRPRSHPQN